MRNFPLQGFSKHLHWFRCSGKGEYLNLTARQNPAANPLTTNALQDFQRLHPWFRSLAGLECRGMQMCPGSTSGRGFHQTRSRTAHASEPEQNSRIHCNTLRNFPLQGFSKHLHWFRCSGKGEHLNHAERQNPAAKPLTANALQDFQQLCPWFRCNSKWKHQKNRYTNAKRDKIWPCAILIPYKKELPLTEITLQQFASCTMS